MILGIIEQFQVFKKVKDMSELTQATEPAVWAQDGLEVGIPLSGSSSQEAAPWC